MRICLLFRKFLAAPIGPHFHLLRIIFSLLQGNEIKINGHLLEKVIEFYLTYSREFE
jgi:hypothetical protein